MYATGAVLLPFFSFMTFLVAVPTGVKFFNWIGTMWKGQVTFESPMLFSVGFHTTFLVQHWLGNEGMPRRYADYLTTDGFTTLNTISTIGAYLLRREGEITLTGKPETPATGEDPPLLPADQ